MHRRELVSSLTLSSVALLAKPSRTWAQGAEKIRVAGVLTEDITSLYYAIKTGMFQKVGLDVEIAPTSSGAAATTALIAGTYEIAKPALIAVFAAHLRGIPISIIAPGFVHTPQHPNALLQIAADSPYKTATDLNGRTMGVQALNDIGSLACRAWIDKGGGDWKSLRFLELPNSATEEALIQHRVDVASMTSPALDISLAAGTTKTLADGFMAIAPVVMLAGYIARPDWIAQHADVVRKFSRVVSEVSNYFNTHLTETAQWVSDMTKIEFANVSKMNRTMLGTTLDVRLVQPLIDAAVKYGVIPRAFNVREIFWTGR